MFEKSLYDLIRGLRNHKGHEKEYVQKCLKECRDEIRGQDMDLKATAMLKLVYLEMWGHDMSWAAFNVLEVMSSPKYHQKRVGYLAAIQSFRPDTEVLMLATNLLKKDIAATPPTIISLPITALPHLITPSLALSVLTDLLPRLGHSQPAIRKKTIVTLYRMALVYPESLRAAWPKIKERLLDIGEDASVTAAIVNVVCELGWRRPHDFLPLAPRLFDLLVDSGNNWMAIKLIKLFATLTPLEPRLVRKLLPPLTDLIRTTPAMSLLYECINGIIQGGILGESEDISGREEIASLCVTKLRGMIMTNSDPNLKYVALLAFNRIVVTHPFLVSQQEDVIMECIDSEDITIRIQALDLVQGMVSSENLISIIGRLMRQLKASSTTSLHRALAKTSSLSNTDDDDDTEEEGKPTEPTAIPPLPEDYKVDVIGRVLNMCSQNNYGSLSDFNWYIDVLTQLVRVAPLPRRREVDKESPCQTRPGGSDVSERIGNELRNVAVKVKAVRTAVVQAAAMLIYRLNLESSSAHPVISGALKPLAWTVGEYGTELFSANETLGYLLQLVPRISHHEALVTCLQSIIKLLATVAGDKEAVWTAERKSSILLLMARVIHGFEPLASHPYLEVQERAVQFIELLKLTAEAVSGHSPSAENPQQDAPLLLTQAIPSLFHGWELNSVASGAQGNLPIPDWLDLNEPIHHNLSSLLGQAESPIFITQEDDEFQVYYTQKPPPISIASEPAINRLADASEPMVTSYQEAGEESYLDPDILARRKAERQERNQDDPFYIRESGSPWRTSTPIHDILQKENGPDLDIDAIPIMKLDLVNFSPGDPVLVDTPRATGPSPNLRSRRKVVVAADETLGDSGGSMPCNKASEKEADGLTKSKARKLGQRLLQVDSSHLGSLRLSGDPGQAASALDHERQQREEAEMAQAMKEVERLRLEMQRANERIQVAQGVEGTVVKKKTKRTKRKEGEAGAVKVKKKVRNPVKASGDGETVAPSEGKASVKVKRNAKNIAQLDDAEV